MMQRFSPALACYSLVTYTVKDRFAQRAILDACRRNSAILDSAMRKFCFSLLVVFLTGLCVFAEGTRNWLQSSFEDFEKGTAKGIAIRNTGDIELAPDFKSILTTPSTYIWGLASDAQGNVYAAAGSPARVYRITPDGQSSVIFQPAELQVQALVVDKDGAIYAATSPDGKVYKIQRRSPQQPSSKPGESAAQPSGPGLDPNWTSSVFFQPKTKYIWALDLDNEGRLYVATGDQGEIYRVDKNGNGSIFFKSDEAHIRALAFDPRGNLIAGSDGSGLVYRISPTGEAFVLYSAAKKEITALAVDRAGNIYASAVGDKRLGGNPPVPTSGAMPLPQPSAPLMPAMPSQPLLQPGAGAGMPFTPGLTPVLIPGMSVTGSDIYRIAPDGSPTRLWTSQNDVVYALALDGSGNLLAGTGNRGRVFSIHNDEEFTDLVKASATQVTAFAKAPNGGLYVSTSNLGKLFLLSGSPNAEGSYESDVFDAHIFSRWGRAEVRGSGAFQLWARSGNVENPDRNWSAWKQVDLARDLPLSVPPARFIQWKAVLHPGATPAKVESVLINYLPKNVAPKLEDVKVVTGWRAQNPPHTLGDNSAQDQTSSSPQGPNPSPVRDKNSILVKWTAHDENDDQLVYSIFYRGDGEQNWKLLTGNLTDPYYCFNASLLPDGGYTIKVVASDAPSHSPEDVLADARESNRFEIDTTPPQVQGLNAAVEGNQLHITFRAVDGFSSIRRAEYSVDAGQWQYVEPVGRLSDYRLENYDFAIPLPGVQRAAAANGSDSANGRTQPVADPIAPGPASSSEHVVAVRVYDKFDNVGLAKTVLRLQPTAGANSASARSDSNLRSARR
jgi:WD domain, G-beta repeat